MKQHTQAGKMPIDYHQIFLQTPSPLAVTDGSAVLDANAAALECFQASSVDELNRNEQLIEHIHAGRRAGGPVLFRCGQGVFLTTVSSIAGEKELYISAWKHLDLHASYRKVLSHIFEEAALLDLSGKFIDATEQFLSLFCPPGKDIEGLSLQEIILDRDIMEALRRCIARGEQNQFSSKVRTKSGTRQAGLIVFPVFSGNHCFGTVLVLQCAPAIREHILQQLFRQSLFPTAILDTEETILDLNPEFERLFGYSKDALLGKSINDFIIPPDKAEESTQFISHTLQNITTMRHTQRMDASGRIIDVEAVGSPVTLNGQVIGMFAMYKDISKEQETLRELRFQKAYFQQLFDNSPTPIVLLDQREHVVIINDAFSALFGFTQEELSGKPIAEHIIPEGHKRESLENSRKVLHQKRENRLETKRMHASGSLIDVEVIAYPVFVDQSLFGAFAVYYDLTERKQWEREVHRLIYTDQLTGLYNRTYWYKVLSDFIGGDTPAEERRALILYFDLDGFKEVNDTYGHSAGDQLLQEISKRLHSLLSPDFELFRLGGDEFAAYSPNAETAPEAVSERIHNAFCSPFPVQEHAIRSRISIGFSRYPEDGRTADELLHCADAMMYREKTRQRKAGR